MTGATPQIFDLMLGPAVTSTDGQVGGDSGAVGDGLLFANLLGGFLEGQSAGQNGIDLQQLLAGLNPEQALTLELPNPLVDSEVEELASTKLAVEVDDLELAPAVIDRATTGSTDPAKAISLRSMILGLQHLPQQSDLPSLSKADDTLINNPGDGTGRIVENTGSALGLLPEAAAIHNQSLKEILIGDQVKVEPGSYKIIESEVSKGQLNLTLVSSETSAEQIKISLSLKSLLQEGSFTPGRATLEPSLMEGPVLEDYISRLKLTSLEIESSLPTDSKQSVLKLFGGTGDRQLLMLSHLDGNGLVGRRKLLRSSTDKVGVGPSDIDEALLDPRSGAEAPAVRSAARPWNDPLLNRLHPLAGKPDQKLTMLSTSSDPFGENVDGVRLNEMIGLDAKIERSSLDGEGVKTRTTRLSLPEDVRTTLKPGGQAITLRIEPEHLGPARLRLAMHNNVLRALVTVDSTQAKLIVEGSLDQLTSQLSKADIQVERIEVALNSDGRHESLPHRRPRQQASLKSESGVEGAGAATTLAGAEGRYGDVRQVGVGGVNLLA